MPHPRDVSPRRLLVARFSLASQAFWAGKDWIFKACWAVSYTHLDVYKRQVYVGDKLLGALSYRIGQFSKEPIAGITPIAQDVYKRQA